MTEYNMYEAKTHLSEIVKSIENNNNDYVVLLRNGKPVAKVVPYQNDMSCRFGVAKGMIDIPKEFDEVFDDIDIASDFEGDI